MKPKFKAIIARGGGLLILAAAALAASGAAQAAGTLANTTISNQATLQYSVGTVPQPQILSSPTGSKNGIGVTTDFKVDNKINHAVATTDGSAVIAAPGQAGVVLGFTVTNNGNATQDYALTAADLASLQTVFAGANQVTDSFDLTAACVIRVNGTVRSYVPSLAPDTSATVTLTCDIPLGQANNAVAGLSLTAQAADAGSSGATITGKTSGANTNSVVDVVFADGAGTDDPANDGKSSARSAFKVQTTTITVTKTVVAVCDPFNGTTNPKNIPGAYVQYTVSIANSGTTAATLTSVSDTLSNSVTFDPNMITGAGTCDVGGTPTSATGAGFKISSSAVRTGFPKFYTTLGDGDGATNVGANISIDFAAALPTDGTHATTGLINAGETLTLVYQVRIN